MAKCKPNPVLAAFEARKEAEFRGRLRCNDEINLMSMLIAANRLGLVGPGRSGDLLAEMLSIKMQIAEDLIEDSKDDQQLWKTKADLYRIIQPILGEENWKKYQSYFPMLEYYWVQP